MDACVICGGGLPEVSLSTRDPFCSTACAREHYGTGEEAMARGAISNPAE